MIADQQLAGGFGGPPQGPGPGGPPQGGPGGSAIPGLEAFVRDRGEFVIKTLESLLNP